ncbi:NAD(P)-binding protein [Gymnopus androsaceus JB14]|uniref:NAD(P)-binding protein n=1 Tax=Gymnopus androsaceus JB14 TaxID=1447944 RepID=A0A6A4I184_9AGAR|nr:NAD(P)-binding protein [Gymnopus androsaceus JB14]
MHLIIGTGNVGLPLSRLFHTSNIPALSTSRAGNAASDIIQSIFMTPPPSIDMVQAMKPFIDFAAKEKGVKRFVLLSSSLVPPLGGIVHGAVHKYISELGVEYAAIRPSWFFQNFHPPAPGFVFYADPENGTVISSTGSGKVGFVDARDIAESAFRAMTEKEPLNGSYIVFGPELLTYTDVAKILSSVTGRSITHRNLSRSEFEEHAKRVIPHTEAITTVEDMLRNGAEERLFLDGGAEDGKEKEVIWKGKRSFQIYAEEIKDVWMN